jgi:hypothetical protein
MWNGLTPSALRRRCPAVRLLPSGHLRSCFEERSPRRRPRVFLLLLIGLSVFASPLFVATLPAAAQPESTTMIDSCVTF